MRIRGEQHLGVAVGLEGISGRAQFVAQRAEVVDRAVENEMEPAVRRGHGLVAVRRIEDRESAHTEGRGALRNRAAVIRAAVLHGRAHPFDGRGTGLGGIKRADETG